jgi:hypothetical protein
MKAKELINLLKTINSWLRDGQTSSFVIVEYVELNNFAGISKQGEKLGFMLTHGLNKKIRAFYPFAAIVITK